MTRFTCLICRAFDSFKSTHWTTRPVFIWLNCNRHFDMRSVKFNTFNVCKIFCELIYFHLRYNFVSYSQLLLITCILNYDSTLCCFLFQNYFSLLKIRRNTYLVAKKSNILFFPLKALMHKKEIQFARKINASKETEVWHLKSNSVDECWCLGVGRLSVHSIRFDSK